MATPDAVWDSESWRTTFVTPREGLEVEFEFDDLTHVLHDIRDDGDNLTGFVSNPEIPDMQPEEFVIEKGTRLQASREFVLRNKLGIAVGAGAISVSAATGFLVRKYFKHP